MPAADLHELAEEYRPEFPIFRSATYLNSCSLGALSERSRSALAEFADLWDRWGASAWYEHWLAAAQDVRSAFARLVGADESETALAPSVSGALATVTSALPFDQRPRVITTELDALLDAYHAGETPWIVVSNEVGLGLVPHGDQAHRQRQPTADR